MGFLFVQSVWPRGTSAVERCTQNLFPILLLDRPRYQVCTVAACEMVSSTVVNPRAQGVETVSSFAAPCSILLRDRPVRPRVY